MKHLRKTGIFILVAFVIMMMITQVNTASATSYWTPSSSWISKDSELTGAAWKAKIKATDINNLRAYAYGGFWGGDKGAVQITIDTGLAAKYFYAEPSRTYKITFRWICSGYHQDRSGNKAFMEFGYAVLKKNADLKAGEYELLRSWRLPDGERTDWDHHSLSYVMYFTPSTSGHYRLATCINVWQGSGTWDPQRTDFYNGANKIDMENISIQRLNV